MPRSRSRLLGLGSLLLAILVVPAATLLVRPVPGTARAQLVLEATTQLSASPTRRSTSPRLVLTRDGAVFVAWEEHGAVRPGLADVFYRYLPAAPDATWLPAQPRHAVHFGESPALASFGSGEVGLAFRSVDPYTPPQIQYLRWDPTRAAWPTQPDNLGGIAAGGVEPDIAFEPDGSLWLAWIDANDLGRRAAYARIPRGGGAPSGGTVHECYSTSDAYWPRIAMVADQDASEQVHIVWYEDRYAEGAYLQHAWRAVGGSRWTCGETELQYFQNSQGFARAPVVDGTDPDSLCIVWQEGDGPLGPGQPQEIIRYCLNPGQIFNQSNLATRSVTPNLVLAPPSLRLGPLVIWEQQRDKRVWFGHSDPPVTVPLRDNARMPDLAFDPSTGEAHAVWVEDTPEGGSEVYYARWTLVTPATPSSTPSPSASPSPTATLGPGTPSRTPDTPEPTPTPHTATPRTPTATASGTVSATSTHASDTPTPLPNAIHLPFAVSVSD